MGYYLTADGGTESLRARIYDETGQCLGSHAVAYDTQFSAGGRAEQNPADWWNNFVSASRAAIADAGIDAQAIDAICYATTSCSVVALDSAGNALRPAMIWMDVRASHETELVLATGDPALKINSDGRGPVSAEWMIPKALWLKRNEPEHYQAACRICEYQDFLTFKLTGEWAASLDNVGLRWHYDNAGSGWASSLVNKLDMGDIIDKWPARVVAPGDVIGQLSATAASELGLSTRVKVVQGGADALIGMIGLGVSMPGQLALITGSSHLVFGVTERPVHSPGMWGAYPDIVYPGRYIVEGGQTSTGSIINWLGRMSGTGMDYEALNAAAEKLPPGSEGLLVQDHFQGNRTPYTDSLSRGAIVGLTLAHEKHHIFRAMMEGIGFGTRAILDSFKRAGYMSDQITVGGGATASPLFLQIHADTAALPVLVPESADAPSTGSAVLAAVGAGQFDSIDKGITTMVKPGRKIDPIKENVDAYHEIYERYLKLYPAMKSILA